VGCNYPGTTASLEGCVNDVFNIKRFLIGTIDPVSTQRCSCNFY
jgi:hypothetical protein